VPELARHLTQAALAAEMDLHLAGDAGRAGGRGSPSQDSLNLLAGWAATTDEIEQPAPTNGSEPAEQAETPD